MASLLGDHPIREPALHRTLAGCLGHLPAVGPARAVPLDHFDQVRSCQRQLGGRGGQEGRATPEHRSGLGGRSQQTRHSRGGCGNLRCSGRRRGCPSGMGLCLLRRLLRHEPRGDPTANAGGGRAQVLGIRPARGVLLHDPDKIPGLHRQRVRTGGLEAAGRRHGEGHLGPSRLVIGKRSGSGNRALLHRRRRRTRGRRRYRRCCRGGGGGGRGSRGRGRSRGGSLGRCRCRWLNRGRGRVRGLLAVLRRCVICGPSCTQCGGRDGRLWQVRSFRLHVRAR
mmetsp:Transcript_84034/g.270800  ORF Transcript_84034/g.270800 Transcript_84034/m.270800 type:complete len:281 (+) Transcript_84034:350-1192(+)